MTKEKEWIRLERAFPAWQNNKTNTSLYIVKSGIKSTPYKITSNHFHTEYFGNRTLAFKWAKSYMKNN